jgi:hypothetical protein
MHREPYGTDTADGLVSLGCLDWTPRLTSRQVVYTLLATVMGLKLHYSHSHNAVHVCRLARHTSEKILSDQNS